MEILEGILPNVIGKLLNFQFERRVTFGTDDDLVEGGEFRDRPVFSGSDGFFWNNSRLVRRMRVNAQENFRTDLDGIFRSDRELQFVRAIFARNFLERVFQGQALGGCSCFGGVQAYGGNNDED